MEEFDVAVVGGGAAGLTAAQLTQAAGKRTVLITDGKLGGECTWTGCLPSKALIEAARIRHDIGRAAQFGILAENARVHFPAVMAYVRNIIDTIAGFEDVDHLTKKGITVRFGRARLTDQKTLQVDGTPLRASRIILCTGSKPDIPAIQGLRDAPYHTNETIFDLDSLPDHLVIVGAGPTGIEIGQAFRRLGSKVTLLDKRSTLLPDEDSDVQSLAHELLVREGLDIELGTSIDRVQFNDGVFRLTVTREGRYENIEGDRLLVATGRKPNVADIGLESMNIQMAGSGVRVDECLRTSVRTIFAAGDVTGLYYSTHIAAYQARVAAQNALGQSARVDYRVVPRAIFTDPPIAVVGLTERQARSSFGDIRVSVLPYTAIDRAVIGREIQGFIKVVTGKKRTLGLPVPGFRGGGELLGAHLVGAGAADLIHEFVVTMQTRSFTGRLAQAIHIYPTFSLGVQQAVGSLFPGVRASIDLREELNAKE